MLGALQAVALVLFSSLRSCPAPGVRGSSSPDSLKRIGVCFSFCALVVGAGAHPPPWCWVSVRRWRRRGAVGGGALSGAELKIKGEAVFRRFPLCRCPVLAGALVLGGLGLCGRFGAASLTPMLPLRPCPPSLRCWRSPYPRPHVRQCRTCPPCEGGQNVYKGA